MSLLHVLDRKKHEEPYYVLIQPKLGTCSLVLLVRLTQHQRAEGLYEAKPDLCPRHTVWFCDALHCCVWQWSALRWQPLQRTNWVNAGTMMCTWVTWTCSAQAAGAPLLIPLRRHLVEAPRLFPSYFTATIQKNPVQPEICMPEVGIKTQPKSMVLLRPTQEPTDSTEKSQPTPAACFFPTTSGDRAGSFP